MTQLLLFISGLFYISGTQAQEISVLECKYSLTVVRQNDSSLVQKIVWITADKIFEFNEDDPSKCSLYDFHKNIRTLSMMGTVHELDLKKMRLPTKIVLENNDICKSRSSATLLIQDNHETVYLDSSIHIPSFASGYRDFLDNGTGYLPVYSKREATNDIDGNTIKVSIHICLLSTENKMIEADKLIIK